MATRQTGAVPSTLATVLVAVGLEEEEWRLYLAESRVAGRALLPLPLTQPWLETDHAPEVGTKRGRADDGEEGVKRTRTDKAEEGGRLEEDESSESEGSEAEEMAKQVEPRSESDDEGERRVQGRRSRPAQSRPTRRGVKTMQARGRRAVRMRRTRVRWTWTTWVRTSGLCECSTPRRRRLRSRGRMLNATRAMRLSA